MRSCAINMSTSSMLIRLLLIRNICTTLSTHFDEDRLILNPHLNQSSSGSWSITAYKIGVSSIWHQDDANQLLYLKAGAFNNMYFMDAFWFNSTGHLEMIKTNQSSTIHHQYECVYSAECDYNCEVDGYNESYLQYAGPFTLLSPPFDTNNNVSVFSYIGPALDALGVLPVIVYGSFASDNPEVLLYRGMDILMSFGGLGRYYFPGKLYNEPPLPVITQHVPKLLGCPLFEYLVDDFKNIYNQPEPPEMDPFKSMIASGIFVNERNGIYTKCTYRMDNELQIFNLTFNGHTYWYNGSMGLIYEHSTGKERVLNSSYHQLLSGLSGYPGDIAYSGRYLVGNYTFRGINITGLMLDVFSGNVLSWDGTVKSMIKYFDAERQVLVGMDIIKQGIVREESYDFSKTGYQRLWFTEIEDKFAITFQ